jgi:hypothetical protein
MPDILHRLTIEAPTDDVRPLLATKEGLAQWWTGRPLGGGDAVGEELLLYFGGDEPAAVTRIVEQTPEQVAWLCVQGPSDWIDTEIRFTLRPTEAGGTTLLFSHAGWSKASEFMSMCSTHWASYLIGMKSGLEGRDYTPTRRAKSTSGSDSGLARARVPLVRGAGERGQPQLERMSGDGELRVHVQRRQGCVRRRCRTRRAVCEVGSVVCRARFGRRRRRRRDGDREDGGRRRLGQRWRLAWHTGYSIVSTDSLDSAVELAKGCPVLEIGGAVDVYEAIATHAAVAYSSMT